MDDQAVPRCRDCRFWFQKSCRKHAPKPEILTKTDAQLGVLVWPGTEALDWCGWHEKVSVFMTPKVMIYPPTSSPFPSAKDPES